MHTMNQLPMNKCLLCCFALVSTPCLAELRLPKILGSGMVLQRDSEVRIWGWADAGEQVVVHCDWLDASVDAAADSDGKWQLTLTTVGAGGPHSISIAAENTIELNDILFGEVWLASGQSNMEMPLVSVSDAYTGIQNADAEVASSAFPEIRLFQVGNFSSREPLDDVQSGIEMYGIPPAACQWNVCAPETIPYFASTAYFFARNLHSELKVPIGIIDSSWGGTPAEAWTPVAGLEKLGYSAELDQAATAAQDPTAKIPTRLYNGMIHPLRNFKIKGAIWYQGEGNAGRAEKYRDLFATMIELWRGVFGYEFPFYFVQIAPFNYSGINAAYLREAQLETMSVSHTGMAVTMDIGNLTDIHPKNKQQVGRRLALWALAKDYGRELIYSGPIFAEAEYENGRVRLSFDHLDGGLGTNDDRPPSHFSIAGADQVFHAATAVIDGDQVIVSCDDVKQPAAVRYAFDSGDQPNLINRAGLPASSFRTDRW